MLGLNQTRLYTRIRFCLRVCTLKYVFIREDPLAALRSEVSSDLRWIYRWDQEASPTTTPKERSYSASSTTRGEYSC